ncbi:hypothetical protein C8R41DRAFT_766116 [Lentinula lateritia]|uniref:Uncharacterized protein n=1 Tax=Lentinula lateritia TaxID=40482 RepID=A0ABQ8VEH6_9AGAR|nr:hypothetical protein C8R41DRAFT_766116 [Lentinula lateritia]
MDFQAAASTQDFHRRQSRSTGMIMNGQKLLVYDIPLTPRRGSWAFQYMRKAAEWSAIPLHTDVLHGPPAHHLDSNGPGCKGLLDALWRFRPTLHVFGYFMHERCRD